MFQTLASQISAVIAACVFAYAAWRGERPERLAAAAMALAWLATAAVATHDLLNPQWGVLVVDVMLFAALAWLTITTQRGWTGVAAAAQLIGAATHLAIAVDLRIQFRTYVVALGIWTFVSLGALAWGVVAADLGRRRGVLRR